MTENQKLKVGLYWAASCGGCDIAIVELGTHILELVEVADLVFWPVALDFKYKDVEAMPDGFMDLCLFNGSVRTSEQEHMAKLFRAKSKVLVAFGSCAYEGGIPALANLANRDEVFDRSYHSSPSTTNPDRTMPVTSYTVPEGELTLPEFYTSVRTLAQTVPVEYFIPGCPPNHERVWEVLLAVVKGELPPAGSVVGAFDKTCCDECPRTKEEKRIKRFVRPAEFVPEPEKCLLEQGLICAGPATRSGCGSKCINANMPCRGCFGPPAGVTDQGAKLLSAVASVIDSTDPNEIQSIVDGIADPAGTFYRFGLAGSLLGGARMIRAPAAP
jgi:F420-non-reducing hydrogenase small subunit